MKAPLPTLRIRALRSKEPGDTPGEVHIEADDAEDAIDRERRRGPRRHRRRSAGALGHQETQRTKSRSRPANAGRHGPKLTWAVGTTGRATHISEAANGRACACVCPVCRGPLIAKQGKVMEHHFAHASGDECQHALETALHLAAKDILATRKEIVLPAVEVRFCFKEPIEITPQRRWPIQSVAVEQKLGSIIPDVIARIGGRHLLVEVTVTHRTDKEKLKKIQELGVSCLEIDLSKTERRLTRDEIEKIVVDGAEKKRWLHNVRTEKEGRKMLSEATLLFSVHRGLATHADGCPIPERTWSGKPYANMVDDCAYCPHRLEIDFDVGVVCDGFRMLKKPPPHPSHGTRLPPEAFRHAEEVDPVTAAGDWLDKHRRARGPQSPLL